MNKAAAQTMIAKIICYNPMNIFVFFWSVAAVSATTIAQGVINLESRGLHTQQHLISIMLPAASVP